MKFHSIHGGNIRLEAEKTLAVRKKGFCDGITFSHKPIKIGQCYSISITYAKQWSGALRLGLTSHEPGGFSHDNGALGVIPKYSCPDLISKDGFWAKPVREEHTANEGGTKITFQVTSSGKMLLFINNELKGAHLTDVPTNGPLWAIIDVYGTTDSVQILPEGEPPLEVIARGPKFLEAYKRAMAGGTAPMRHFRLYIAGREGVGKTSLAKSLTGQLFDPEELPTAGIECMFSYEVEVGSGKPWSQVSPNARSRKPSQTQDEDSAEDESSEKSDEPPATVEEKELLYSIARNILREIKQAGLNKHSPSKSQDSLGGWKFFTEDNNGNLKTSLTKARAASQNNSSNNARSKNLSHKGSRFRNFVKKHQQSVAPEEKERIRTVSFLDWHQPVPEISSKLLSAIEDILGENDEHSQGSRKSSRSLKLVQNLEEDKKITLDIWDMSGNYGYYPALLSCLVNRAIYLVVFDLTSDLDALSAPDVNGNGNEYFESCHMVPHRRRSSSAPGNPEKRGQAEDEETISAKSINRSRSSQACNKSGSFHNNGEWELTNLDYILHWLECIFVHATASAMKHEVESLAITSEPAYDDIPVPAAAGKPNANDEDALSLPVVFIVGTRKNALNVVDLATRDKLINDKFSRIKEAITGKPYERLVNLDFLAVENNPSESTGVLDDEDASKPEEDESLAVLRQKVADAGWKIQLTSHQVPLTWLQLRARLAASANDGVNFLSFEQVRQLAEDDSGGIYLHPKPTSHHSFNHKDHDVDLWSALDFLHDVGSVSVCNINGETVYGSSPDMASISDVGTVTPLVVLKPAWLAQVLATVLHPCLPVALNRSLELSYSNKNLDEANQDEKQSVWTSDFNPSLRRFNNETEESWEVSCSRFSPQWNHLEREGILEQCLYQKLFPGESWVQESILALLAHHDILATSNGAGCGPQQCGQTACRRAFYTPSRIFLNPPPERLLQEGDEDVMYYIHFHGCFSDALFARLVTRLIQWSQDSLHVTKKPMMYFRTAVLWLEGGHTLILQMSPLRYSRVKVRLTRQTHLDDFGYDLNASSRSGVSMGISRNSRRQLQRENCYNGMPKPVPQICAKVRHVLESQLLQMKQSWVRRLNCKFMIRCPCDKACDLHRKRSCLDENCLHFLLLDECLTNSVVPCDYRRIRTEPYRLWFPSASPSKRSRNPSGLSLSPRQLWMMDDGRMRGRSPSKSLKQPSKFWDPLVSDRAVLSIPDHLLPGWMTSAAKMLTGSPEGNDWTALGAQLGYRASKLDQLDEALYPALSLLRDWVSVSGNSYFCLETLISCLDQIHRQDVSNMIRKSSILGSPTTQPPDVFISYDWEAQEEVLLIRTNLEKNGFVCWMDVGQMGGGDSLYARIYQGISQAKVFLCLLTPRYVVSQWSRREMSLADIMRKPILPVMLTRTPWPPPGPMAIVLAPLVFIDMSGMGGHGGSGRHGDWETRFQEIVFQISAHATAKQGSMMALAVRPKSNAQILEVSDFGRSKLDVGDGFPSDGLSTARMNRNISSSSLGAPGGILRINPNLPSNPQPIFIQDEPESPMRSSVATSAQTARSSMAWRRRRCCCYPCLHQEICSIL